MLFELGSCFALYLLCAAVGFSVDASHRYNTVLLSLSSQNEMPGRPRESVGSTQQAWLEYRGVRSALTALGSLDGVRLE